MRKPLILYFLKCSTCEIEDQRDFSYFRYYTQNVIGTDMRSERTAVLQLFNILVHELY